MSLLFLPAPLDLADASPHSWSDGLAVDGDRLDPAAGQVEPVQGTMKQPARSILTLVAVARPAVPPVEDIRLRPSRSEIVTIVTPLTPC